MQRLILDDHSLKSLLFLFLGLKMVCLMKRLAWLTAMSHRTLDSVVCGRCKRCMKCWQDWIRVPIHLGDKDQLLAEVEKTKQAPGMV